MDINLTFKSNNKILIMNKTSEFKILSISGISTIENEISTSNINGSGVSVTGQKMASRDITVKFDIKKNDNEDLNRDNVLHFFNINNSGTLTITRNNVSRKIDYIVKSIKETSKYMIEWQQFTIDLLCADPLYKSIDDYNKNIAEIGGLFTFPLVLLESGKPMGYRIFNENIVIENDGAVATGVIVTFNATGSVVKPRFTINGEFIEVNLTMELGDTLVISTNNRNKYIKLNGENVMQKMNRQSIFVQLAVGTNTIGYSAESGATNCAVNVVFNKQYMGV